MTLIALPPPAPSTLSVDCFSGKPALEPMAITVPPGNHPCNRHDHLPSARNRLGARVGLGRHLHIFGVCRSEPIRLREGRVARETDHGLPRSRCGSTIFQTSRILAPEERGVAKSADSDDRRVPRWESARESFSQFEPRDEPYTASDHLFFATMGRSRLEARSACVFWKLPLISEGGIGFASCDARWQHLALRRSHDELSCSFPTLLCSKGCAGFFRTSTSFPWWPGRWPRPRP